MGTKFIKRSKIKRFFMILKKRADFEWCDMIAILLVMFYFFDTGMSGICSLSMGSKRSGDTPQFGHCHEEKSKFSKSITTSSIFFSADCSL